MYLYHGTSTRRLSTILKSGIQPRKDEGNWKDHPSRAGHVYLTSAYAIYFAQSACDPDQDEKYAVLQIEVDRLDERKLYADEDALEAYNRKKDGLPSHWDLARRTQFYRDSWKTLDAARSWKSSLGLLGTCSYNGSIKPNMIEKVAIIDPRAVLALASDPSITIQNYHLLGNYYNWLSDALFMGEKTPYQPSNQISDSYRDRVMMNDIRTGIELKYKPVSGWPK